MRAIKLTIKVKVYAAVVLLTLLYACDRYAWQSEVSIGLFDCAVNIKKKKKIPSRLSKEYTSRKTARYSQKCGGSLVGWNEKHPCNAVQITTQMVWPYCTYDR